MRYISKYRSTWKNFYKKEFSHMYFKTSKCAYNVWELCARALKISPFPSRNILSIVIDIQFLHKVKLNSRRPQCADSVGSLGISEGTLMREICQQMEISLNWSSRRVYIRRLQLIGLKMHLRLDINEFHHTPFLMPNTPNTLEVLNSLISILIFMT